MKSIDTINQFLQQPRIAVVGVSRDPKKFGNAVYQTLKKNGFNLVPVHPELDVFQDDPCVSDIQALPSDVTALFICTKPAQTKALLEQAIGHGIKHFWLQQGSSDDKVLEYLKGKDVSFTSGRCILMFAEPVVSFHKFHRFLNRISGKLPS